MKNYLVTCCLLLALKAGASLHGDSVVVVNKGVSGHTTAHLLERMKADVLDAPRGLVIMLAGTNDMINDKYLYPASVFKANYLRLVRAIQSKHQMIIVTIPPFYEPYLMMRHPKEKYLNNDPGKKVDSANRIIRQLATEFKIPLVDYHHVIMAMGGASEDKTSLLRNSNNGYGKDGVHPTLEGYRVLATAIYQMMQTGKMHPSRVICFGDSITQGAYPGILKALLNGG